MFFKKKDFSGSFDYLIVGLGNPGIEYENTRHNAGFMCIDYIAKKCNVNLNKFKHKAYYAQTQIGGKKVVLVKPQTYMNNSGEAVIPLLNFFKIKSENLIVVCDDISLDVGKIRIRRKGSDGGQKGMRSIIEQLGNDNFARVKMGIGKKPNPNYDLAKWVLSKFKADEQTDLDIAIKNSASAVELIVKGQIDNAMNNYNS